MLNLWNPAHLSLWLVFPTAFLLGAVHGITPDEHTWPITFSYSVGSYSSRGGRRVGFLFSLAFTVQRALASVLAFVVLDSFLFKLSWEYLVYIIVGAVMAASGLYIIKKGQSLHVSPLSKRLSATSPTGAGPVAPWLPLLHGFIAGWGVGAFAIIVYTVLVPAMPSVWVSWVPGALFGLGTMVMQMLLGTVFGTWMARRRLSPAAREYVARHMSGRTLMGGGIAFLTAGLLGELFPVQMSRFQVTTPVQVHNLHHLGIGFVLAVIALFGVAVWAFLKSTREARELFSPSGRLATDA